MKYFVSIENNYYMRWQVELLIESFKMHKCEDELVIAIANNLNPTTKKYSHNLTEHKNKFIHHNIGTQYGYKPLNKLYGLRQALENKLLDDCYVILHPDMVLFNRLKMPPSNSGILFHSNNDAWDETTKKIKNQLGQYNVPWWNLGDTMIINKIPNNYVNKTLEVAVDLIGQLGNNWDVERAAWVVAALQLIQSGIPLNFHSQSLEMSMLHVRSRSIAIHYKHGLPTIFNKRFFKDQAPKIVMAKSVDPLDCIFANTPTSSTKYIQTVVKSYRSRVEKDKEKK